MNKKEREKIAEGRAAILWSRYKANGGKITMAEVRELTGHRGAPLYKTFLNSATQGPPVFDSEIEIRRRQIKSLCDKAQSLGKSWLTSHEAAEALGIATKNVFPIDKRLKGEIPEIRYSRSRARRNAPEPELTISDITFSDDPSTLKYYRTAEGPGPNQITYFIR